MEKNPIALSFDAKGMKTEIIQVSAATRELTVQARGLRGALAEAFKIRGIRDYRQTIQQYGKKLADSLLVLQLRMGMLRSAIVDAVMPIAALFVPWINRGVMALTRFFRNLGDVLGILLLGKNALGAMTGSTKKGTQNQEKLRKSIAATGKAARNTLASFDELNRLSAPTGGGAAGQVSEVQPSAPGGVSRGAAELAESIRQYLLPLTEISFGAAAESLHILQKAMEAFLRLVGEQFSWAWYEILVPLGQWTVEQLAPEALGLLTEGFRLLTAALGPVFTGFQNLLTTLAPLGSFIGQVLLTLLHSLGEKLAGLTQVFVEKNEKITGIITLFGQLIAQCWEVIQPVLTTMLSGFGLAFDGIWQAAQTGVSALIEVLHTLLVFLNQVFAGDFAAAWETISSALLQWAKSVGSTLWTGLEACARQIVQVFSRMSSALGNVLRGAGNTVKGAVNGIIGFINGMVSGVVSGINAMIRALNRVHFRIPDWVPALGGSSFGFSISPVQAPRIPYLAKGAVLPANRPFLSVVGDQKHGTNVEAPLATIQQAVAEVMGNMEGGMMAGFEANIAVLKEILEAILGIRIGEDVLANAVSSYNRKMAVVNGGFYL